MVFRSPRTLIFAGLMLATIIFIALYSSVKNTQERKVLPTSALPTLASSSLVELKNGDRYTLTASAIKKTIGGKELRFLAYNGSIPGPTIKVAQGAEVTIHFVNNIDAASTIHSHGLRLDNAFDGVPGVTQKEVLPGESFDYTLKFPDAGVYWYHPHIDEPYEQSLGLYGNFIVTPSEENYWAPVNREIPITLSDVLIGQDGDTVPYVKGRTDHTLMGRYGNVLLTGGVLDYQLTATKGEVIRLYLTNTASARPFHFTIANTKMKLVGSDNGRYEKETFVDGVTIAPSERAIVDVLFSEVGAFPLQNETPHRSYTLGTVTVSDGTMATSYGKEWSELRTNIETVSEFKALAKYQTTLPDKNIRLTIDMPGMGGMMKGGEGGMGMMGGMHKMPDGTMMRNDGGMMMGGDNEKIEWEDSMSMMNAMSDDKSVKWQIVDEETKQVNMDINWKWKVGDKVKIRIENDAKSMHPMQHPIHFHGQRFVVLSTNGVPSTNMVWKDTTLVQKGDSVDILVDVTNPGEWMAHCHVAEHLADGMMLNFSVSK